jgi:hypothetical protein
MPIFEDVKQCVPKKIKLHINLAVIFPTVLRRAQPAHCGKLPARVRRQYYCHHSQMCQFGICSPNKSYLSVHEQAMNTIDKEEFSLIMICIQY